MIKVVYVLHRKIFSSAPCKAVNSTAVQCISLFQSLFSTEIVASFVTLIGYNNYYVLYDVPLTTASAPVDVVIDDFLQVKADRYYPADCDFMHGGS